MVNKKKKIKVLLLLSGGLDSILAVRLLQKQGIEVTGISFVSYFFNEKAAQEAAAKLGINLKVVDFSDEHLALVKNPKYGYGKAANPCIDCHALMLKKAKEIIEKEKFTLVATGEVLGERPLSQNRRALDLVEKESGLKGYLLRPLSAKLLPPTVPEQEGLIDRTKLLDIQGRSRKRQIALAKEWGIKDYPTPAGGCILTDLEFARKLKKLLKKWPDAGGEEMALLRIGRHFWVEDNEIVVGRNKEENEKLKKLSEKGDILIKAEGFPGPTILIRGRPAHSSQRTVEGEEFSIKEESLVKAKELMIKYSPKLQHKLQHKLQQKEKRRSVGRNQ